MNIFSFSRPSRLLLHYGLFICICHATAILFMALTQQSSPPLVLFCRFFPMIEHSIMSFLIIIYGTIGFEYIERSKEQK